MLAQGGGLLLAREHPALARTLRRMAATGDLVRLLPGTFAAPGDTRLLTTLRAVTARYPDAVVTGTAAARIGFWPEAPVASIEVARPTAVGAADFHADRRYVFSKRLIPPSLIRHDDGVRRTAASLTALDLCTDYGSEIIHQVLRSRAATVATLHAAFAVTPHRRGNTERMRVLLATHTAPWSAAEQLAHRLLKEAGITGWVANLPVGVRRGQFLQQYYLDIAFRGRGVAIEIEGNAYHSSGTDLNRDRYRHNDLTIDGWTVIRIDWRMLTEDPAYVVELVRAAVS